MEENNKGVNKSTSSPVTGGEPLSSQHRPNESVLCEPPPRLPQLCLLPLSSTPLRSNVETGLDVGWWLCIKVEWERSGSSIQSQGQHWDFIPELTASTEALHLGYSQNPSISIVIGVLGAIGVWSNKTYLFTTTSSQ